MNFSCKFMYENPVCGIPWDWLFVASSKTLPIIPPADPAIGELLKKQLAGLGMVSAIPSGGRGCVIQPLAAVSSCMIRPITGVIDTKKSWCLYMEPLPISLFGPSVCLFKNRSLPAWEMQVLRSQLGLLYVCMLEWQWRCEKGFWTWEGRGGRDILWLFLSFTSWFQLYRGILYMKICSSLLNSVGLYLRKCL